MVNSDTRLQELATLTQDIQGWVTNDDCAALYHLVVNHIPVPTVVELGSWRGKSTAWLASGVKDRGEGRVHAVDTWQGTDDEAVHKQLLAGYDPTQLFREFLANMARLGLGGLVEAHRMTTVEAARRWPVEQPIGLLFIDAAHDYASVRRDFELWSGFLPAGAFLVLDDVAGWEGPARVAKELPAWYEHCFSGTNIWIGRKTV